MSSNKTIDNLDAEIARLQLARRLLAGETMAAVLAGQNSRLDKKDKMAVAGRGRKLARPHDTPVHSQSLHQR